MTGEKNPMFGKTGIQSPNYGKKASQATIDAIRKSVIKPILKLDIKTKEKISEFDSITNAAKSISDKKCVVGNISACAKGKSNSAYGYIWKYANQ